MTEIRARHATPAGGEASRGVERRAQTVHDVRTVWKKDKARASWLSGPWWETWMMCQWASVMQSSGEVDEGRSEGEGRSKTRWFTTEEPSRPTHTSAVRNASKHPFYLLCANTHRQQPDAHGQATPRHFTTDVFIKLVSWGFICCFQYSIWIFRLSMSFSFSIPNMWYHLCCSGCCQSFLLLASGN